MSRSYKHTPRCGDTKDKFFKNYANRRLRRKKLTHNFKYKSYKKDSCTYDICDYEDVGTTFEEYYRVRVKYWYAWRYTYEDYPNEETEYQNYAKWFLRK